ncbi:hypothetical protein HPB47_014878 [Ixodes persulcatus]|uniref:Uncharacterized protein n=1 Tax=Ixodes persulcatus TaxID=34615 RepID=A0AC60QXB8_IXOPE|nr:hypothetical protein HPB47_014878 [Ixodes persulcatus]
MEPENNERIPWTEQETFALLRLWEDHLGDLRRTKRNAKVYGEIVETLRAMGFSRSAKEVKKKMQNLGNKSLSRKKTTGAGGKTWRFYWDLHRFLGSLPANDSSLMEESWVSWESKKRNIAPLLQWRCLRGANDREQSPEHELASEADSPPESVDPAGALPAEPLPSRSRPRPEAAERAAKPEKRQALQSSLLAQLLEEQRQLWYSHEKSRKRELDIREQQLKLQERAAEREDRLIDVLAQLVNK